MNLVQKSELSSIDLKTATFHLDYNFSAILYSTMPPSSGIRSAAAYILDNMGYLATRGGYDHFQHYVFDEPVNVMGYFEQFCRFGVFFEDRKTCSWFIPSRGYHRNITSHEFVEMQGVFHDPSEPFWADGVGYLGAVYGGTEPPVIVD